MNQPRQQFCSRYTRPVIHLIKCIQSTALCPCPLWQHVRYRERLYAPLKYRHEWIIQTVATLNGVRVGYPCLPRYSNLHLAVTGEWQWDSAAINDLPCATIRRVHNEHGKLRDQSLLIRRGHAHGLCTARGDPSESGWTMETVGLIKGAVSFHWAERIMEGVFRELFERSGVVRCVKVNGRL